MPDPVIVIGAGIGGLSAAIHLARAGQRVLVLEKNQKVGGKMSEYRHAGYRWDTGPSVITMRNVFEDLFNSAGKRLEDYVEFCPVDPLTRYFFADGVRLDLWRDLSKTLEQIRSLKERDVEGYLAYLAYAARLHRILGPVFIYDQPPSLSSLRKVSPWDALRFDGLRSMQSAIESYVGSAHLRQLLGRFATYVGASPFRAPATLNVIADVELNQGVWYPRGGVYQLARALQRLALEMGVQVRTNNEVIRIEVRDGRAAGVRLASGEVLASSALIANLDVITVYNQLLPQDHRYQRKAKRLSQREPSCSGFIMLLGVRGEHPELAHHNIFFSGNYAREFDEIFLQGIPPDEPTIYLAITQRATLQDAPEGAENWFVLVNAPALSSAWDWGVEAEGYAERLLDRLAARGLDIRTQIEVQRLITPNDLEKSSGAWRGALYGNSSNSRLAAFRRPHNRASDVKSLYFCGGTSHPGGGVPMVALSGKVASQMVINDLG